MWVGNHQVWGFSTIESLLALALMLTIITVALDANASAQYWRLSAVTANEALVKTTVTESYLHLVARRDFESVSSTPPTESRSVTDPADASCVRGGVCYVSEVQVSDVSPCLKTLVVSNAWKLGERYSTSTVRVSTAITKPAELLTRGGDCVVESPTGNWLGSTTPPVLSQTSYPPQFTTAFDMLDDRLYVVASSAPQLQVFQVPHQVGENFVLVGTSSVTGMRVNAIDVVRDMSTGRRYAYLLQHTDINQLVVMDVTDDTALTVITSKTLAGVAGGSFPQGWRIMVYGTRAYVLTRETAGPELHIFSITDIRHPVEIASGLANLGRTVNDFTVRDQRVAGVVERFLFLAASSALKEFAIWNVTSDVPTEVAVVNLPGSEDVSSLSVSGNRMYLGRKNSTTGPELFVYDIPGLLVGTSTPLATAEVGADVMALRTVGDMLFMNTNKIGAEFQIWRSEPSAWDPLVANAGRVSYRANSRPLPLGLEVEPDFVYLGSQSFTHPETLTVITTP